MREKNAEDEGLARMNAAAYNVSDYKQRLMDEHHTLLRNQMEGNYSSKKQADAAQRQMDSIIAQRNNATNQALSAAEMEHKKLQMNKYKGDLDTMISAKKAS